MATKRDAGKRLAAVRAAISQIERERDEVTARRRECLLNDDIPGRRRCDSQLRELADDWQAAQDKIALLSAASPPVAPAPESGWTWPSSFEGATAAIVELEPRLFALQAIPRNDRHAGHDAEIDFLTRRRYSLVKLRDSLKPAQEGSAA